MYHGSLKDDQAEVVQALYDSFKENIQNITPTNLSGSICLLKELGESEKAIELIEFIVANREEDARFWNLKGHTFASSVTDPDLISAFQHKFKSLFVERKYTPLDALELAEKSGSLTKEWLGLLSEMSVQEFKELFQSINEEKFDGVIKASLRISSRDGNDDLAEDVKGRAISALKEIAASSLINARRIAQKYNIQP